ncbi:unnamed protein product, partial [Brenthis ino]
MSTYDKSSSGSEQTVTDANVSCDDTCEKKEKKLNRKVCFPHDDHLVTQYFEPANPWQDIPNTTRAQLAAEYLESCRCHGTPPIDSVLEQIRELPDNTIGGSTRAPRLALTDCSLLGTTPTDALEALLRKVQFRRLEIDHADIDDEGAEALFDMVEYYESTNAISIIGPRQFGIRGWQAASRMIKKSSELSELEVCSDALEATHAPALARALRPAACRLRALALRRACLAGEALLCLVIALKTNTSVRELRLDDNNLTPSDASQIGNLLRYNTRIQLLDLSNNMIQDSGLGHIADALVEQAAHSPPSPSTTPTTTGGCESRGLAFLVLWNNQLTRNCVNHLTKIMRTTQSLCVLNVGRNALGADVVRALAAERCPLLSLGLQAARVGADAKAVAQLIRGEGRLQRLDLRDNKIGVAGLQAILSAMKENTTLTQIDLDDPPESNSTTAGPVTAQACTEAAAAARLVRDIRSAARRNEPPASAPAALMRKISLTCHTATHIRNIPTEEERRGRLRSPAPSPAPSPAGSPIPAPSRFSVIPVTPDRVSESPSASRTYCPTPSRFKVVQVAEPPQIKVQQAPRKTSSRFSVTRNYDSIYNPTLPPTSPSPSPSPSPDISETKNDATLSDEKEKTVFEYKDVKTSKANVEESVKIEAAVNDFNRKNVKSDEVLVDDVFEAKSERKDDKLTMNIKTNVCDKVEVKKDNDKDKSIEDINKVTGIHTDVHKNVKTVQKKEPDYVVSKTVVIPRTHIRNVVTQTEEIMTDFIIQIEVPDEVREVKHKTELHKTDDILKETQSVIIGPEQSSSGPGVSEFSEIQIEVDEVSSESVNSDVKSANDSLNNEIIVDSDLVKTSDVKDKHEIIDREYGDTIYLSHNETIDYENIETNIVKALDISDTDKKEKDNSATKVHCDQNVNILDDKPNVVDVKSIDTEDIKSFNNLSSKNLDLDNIVPVRDSVILKKNKSESSLDSPDLEVSRLMRKPSSAFCDSSSSLEISGSSVESLNEGRSKMPASNENRSISKDSSVESASDVTPVNLNVSISSNESVSPLSFGNLKKIHGSLSSLEASVSSVDSAKQEKVMVTSADSGIEYSLQNPSEIKEDGSSNEGTLTCSSSLRESVKKDQETLTSPKRTSSLLDVPALKSKGLERMRKISWVAPSASFHLPKPEEKIEYKLPTNLEKLLSLFQHPSSLFSRSSSDDEKKSASNTPPRKDSSLTSSFWSWGSVTEKTDKEDTDSLSEATDSTLSERVQVSFVDESFSRKLDSKTPSTDTDTLSEFQFPMNSENAKVTEKTTDVLVQKCLALSDKMDTPECDNIDLIMPNELRVYDDESSDKSEKKSEDCSEATLVKLEEKPTDVRPRSFASVLKSNSENSMEKQTSPETAQPVDKLPTKVIRGIKENISPENTLTSSIATTALAMDVTDRQIKNKSITEKSDEKPSSDKAPIANIDETCDMAADLIQLAYIDDKVDEKDEMDPQKELESVDLGKDALSYLMFENQEFESTSTDKQESLAQELMDAEIKEMLDLSPELIIDEAVEIPEIFTVEIKGRKSSPIIPERAKIKKSNSLEDLSKRPVLEEKDSPKLKTIAFKVPESTTPRDIPERRSKLRSRSGSSPKSLPESLNKPCPLTKMDTILSKRKKKVSSLGKMARDSLLALNMSEDEIAEFRRSYKLTSVESLRSLESVSEDANSQSGTSIDSRCKACLRTSQESLMSLDSITEDCRCIDECEKRQNR